MKNMENSQLLNIEGGSTSFTASMLTGIISAFKFIYEMGELAGSTINRLTNGTTC